MNKNYLLRGIPLTVSLFGLITSFLIPLQYRSSIRDSIYMLSLSLVLPSLFLFFVHDKVYRLWLYLSVIYLPIIGYIFFVSSPESNDSWIGPERVFIAYWAAILFFFLSTLFLGVSSFYYHWREKGIR